MRSLLHKLPPPIRDWLRSAKYLEGAVRGVLRRLPLHQLPLCGWRSPRPSGLHWWVSEYVDCDVAARGDRIHTVFPAESIRRTLSRLSSGGDLSELSEVQSNELMRELRDGGFASLVATSAVSRG